MPHLNSSSHKIDAHDTEDIVLTEPIDYNKSKIYLSKHHLSIHSKLEIRDLRGLTKFIPYCQPILVANNPVTIIYNFVKLSINKEDFLYLFHTFSKL